MCIEKATRIGTLYQSSVCIVCLRCTKATGVAQRTTQQAVSLGVKRVLRIKTAQHIWKSWFLPKCKIWRKIPVLTQTKALGVQKSVSLSVNCFAPGKCAEAQREISRAIRSTAAEAGPTAFYCSCRKGFPFLNLFFLWQMCINQL